MFAKLFKRKSKCYPDFLSWARCFIPQVKKGLLKKDIGKEVLKAMDEHTRYQTEVFCQWENGIGSFFLADHILGVAFVLTHLVNNECSMLEIVLYSKKGYKASQVGLSFKSPSELFEWLDKRETPEECYRILMELLDILNSID